MNSAEKSRPYCSRGEEKAEGRVGGGENRKVVCVSGGEGTEQAARRKKAT